MKISISRQKSNNPNKRKQRSTLSAILQTGLFVFGIVAVIFSVMISLASKDQDALKGEYQSISFSKLSSFEYIAPKTDQPNQFSSIPQEVRDLNGKKVWLSGFMLPYEVDDDGNVSKFSLNGNYDMCYFGAPVSINEWVMVNISDNLKVKYTHLPITVFGTFEVGEEYKDGEVSSVYRLNLERVGS